MERHDRMVDAMRSFAHTMLEETGEPMSGIVVSERVWLELATAFGVMAEYRMDADFTAGTAKPKEMVVMLSGHPVAIKVTANDRI